MLDGDIFVNHKSLDIDGTAGILKHMEDTLSFSGKDLQDAVLVLCAYCFCLSQEEFSLLYPLNDSFFKVFSSRVLKPLIKEKLLTEEKASAAKDREGTARVFYTITKAGYDYAHSLCHGRLTAKYKKERAKIARSHTYYIGYNLIQILLLGYAVTWQREYLLNAPYVYTKKKKILQVDAKADLYEAFGQSPFMTVYVEQDMGSEKNDVLFGKLSGYAELSLMDNPKKSLVLFSFSPKGVRINQNTAKQTNHPYDVRKIEALLEYLNFMHLDDAYEAYVTGFPEHGFIEKFLLVTGAGKEVKNDTILKRGSVTADRAFIEEFKALTKSLRNPYLHKEYNMQRVSFARKRLEDMVKLIYAYAGDKDPCFDRMRQGYQVFYLPTTLVANRLPFAFLSRAGEELGKLSVSLKRFDALTFVDEVSADTLSLDKGVRIRLRNEFSYGKGSRLFVEFPALDLGAWLRILHFSRLYHKDVPIILVCVFETRQQLSDFYRTCNAYMDDFGLSKSNILCLMFHDIGRTDRLFFCKDDSLKRIYI